MIDTNTKSYNMTSDYIRIGNYRFKLRTIDSYSYEDRLSRQHGLEFILTVNGREFNFSKREKALEIIKKLDEKFGIK